MLPIIHYQPFVSLDIPAAGISGCSPKGPLGAARALHRRARWARSRTFSTRLSSLTGLDAWEGVCIRPMFDRLAQGRVSAAAEPQQPRGHFVARSSLIPASHSLFSPVALVSSAHVPPIRFRARSDVPARDVVCDLSFNLMYS